MRRAVFSILILLASVGLCAGGPGYSSSFFYTLSAGTITSSGVITGSNFVSTVATGTAPFASTSTTLCTNLNADSLEGKNSTDFLWLDGTKIMTAGIQFEGATSDTYQTTLTVTDPTAIDKTITLPNATGTVPLLEIGNLFTANQVAPYWRSSVTYNADDPRPYGWPLGVAANADDMEFNAGTGASGLSWQLTDTTGAGTGVESLALFPGFLALNETSGAPIDGFYQKSLGTAFTVAGGFDVVMKIRSIPMGDGSPYGMIGLILADSAGKNGISCIATHSGTVVNTYYGLWTTTAWANPITSLTWADDQFYPYLRIYRAAGSQDAYVAVSRDGMNWINKTAAATKNITFAKIGIYIRAEAQTLPEKTYGIVDWIRVR